MREEWIFLKSPGNELVQIYLFEVDHPIVGGGSIRRRVRLCTFRACCSSECFRIPAELASILEWFELRQTARQYHGFCVPLPWIPP